MTDNAPNKEIIDLIKATQANTTNIKTQTENINMLFRSVEKLKAGECCEKRHEDYFNKKIVKALFLIAFPSGIASGAIILLLRLVFFEGGIF